MELRFHLIQCCRGQNPMMMYKGFIMRKIELEIEILRKNNAAMRNIIFR